MIRSLLRLAGQPVQRSLDLVLPRVCIACGLSLQRSTAPLCSVCMSGLPGVRDRRCPRCAALMATQSLHAFNSICAGCERQPPAFDASFALSSYTSPIDQMIHALKFARRWSLGQALGTCLGEQIGARLLTSAGLLFEQARAPKSTLFLCPIPLSAQRFIERGFNQSQLILTGLRSSLEQSSLAGAINIIPANLLLRQRHTEAQTLVAPERRQQNLHQAFVVRRPCSGAVVVLVDDVMTSGATLSNAAHTLKSAGAAAIINAVVARAD
jgi:ComF family protein